MIELFKNNTVYGQIQEDEIAKAVLNAQFIRELIGGDSIKGKSKKREQIRHVHFTNLFYCSGTEYLMQFKDSR